MVFISPHAAPSPCESIHISVVLECLGTGGAFTLLCFTPLLFVPSLSGGTEVTPQRVGKTCTLCALHKRGHSGALPSGESERGLNAAVKASVQLGTGGSGTAPLHRSAARRHDGSGQDPKRCTGGCWGGEGAPSA